MLVVERKEKQELGELVQFGVPKHITTMEHPEPVRWTFLKPIILIIVYVWYSMNIPAILLTKLICDCWCCLLSNFHLLAVV